MVGTIVGLAEQVFEPAGDVVPAGQGVQDAVHVVE